MEEDAEPGSRARASLAAYFRRKSFPRLTLSLILVLTGVSGFLISYGLLRLGLVQMWLRYPLAALAGYGVLLGLVRGWVEVERARFDPIKDAIRESEERTREHSFRNQPQGNSWLDWLHWLDLAEVGTVDLSEGCLAGILVVIVIVVIIALAATIVVAVSAAQALVAEVFLDAFIVTALYRHLRVAQMEHWLGAALRRTWAPALVTAAALGVVGWSFEQIAPGAPSIGKAIQQLREAAGSR